MKKLLMVVFALCISVQAVDQKSLLLGVAIGLGVYTTQHGIVPVVAAMGHGTKVAAKKTAKGVRRAVVGPRKSQGGKHGATKP